MIVATVVIPSLESDPLTRASVPDEWPVIVQRDSPLAAARTRGVQNANTELVAVIDGDLRFDPDWLRAVVRRAARADRTVYAAAGTGLLERVAWPQGFAPGMSRCIVAPAAAWSHAGPFVEPGVVGHDPDYGSDTDWLARAWKAGYRIVPLDHQWEHVDDDRDGYSLVDHARWLGWLARRHPRLIGTRVPAVLAAKARGVEGSLEHSLAVDPEVTRA